MTAEPPRPRADQRSRRGAVPATYARLREQYRPARVRLLLVGESPPDPRGGQLRFFYAPTLTSADDLFRAVAESLYGQAGASTASKDRTLRRLQEEGVFLIDVLDEPVNTRPKADRKTVLQAAVPRLVARCRELDPERGVVVCQTSVFRIVDRPLRAAGVRVAHDAPLPFPVRYRPDRRLAFMEGLRAAFATVEP